MILQIFVGIGVILLILIVITICLEAIGWIEDKFDGILWRKERYWIYRKKKKVLGGEVSNPREKGRYNNSKAKR